MRLNMQQTDQRIFGNQSDRGTGMQAFNVIVLPVSLAVARLTSRVWSLRAYLFECVAATLSTITQAFPAGIAGNQANQQHLPDSVGLKPSLGDDPATRVGWIAG